MQEKHEPMAKRKMPFVRMAVLVFPLVLLLLLSQTVFAQNTYVITDGERVLVHTSAATDPALVLDEAGLALGADDTYTTQPGIGVSEITIQRSAEPVSVQETVAQLLEQQNIPMDINTAVSVPHYTQLSEDMQLTAGHRVLSTQTYTATLPYETVYCYDPQLPEGTETVVTQGRNGQLQCTANVVYVDGEEISRTVISETVTSQPVNQVVALGTAKAPDTTGLATDGIIIGENTITLPTGEVLTYTDTWQVQGTAYTHTDAGCDFITATGTTVRIGTVAVDPRYIPYGTRMFIVSNDGEYVYGISTAEDCGGGIKHARVDLYYPTYEECIQFGRRDCTIYFLG